MPALLYLWQADSEEGRLGFRLGEYTILYRKTRRKLCICIVGRRGGVLSTLMHVIFDNDNKPDRRNIIRKWNQLQSKKKKNLFYLITVAQCLILNYFLACYKKWLYKYTLSKVAHYIFYMFFWMIKLRTIHTFFFLIRRLEKKIKRFNVKI